MWGWLEGIFEWLGDQLRPIVTWIGDTIMRFKFFVVALVAAILAPINWILDWIIEAWNFADAETTKLLTTVQGANMGQAPDLWSAISTPAALMNCVVPLDYALALGTLLLSVSVGGAILKALIWAYKLIPFKTT